MTQSQTSVSKISKEIRVPSSPSGRFTSSTWAKIDEWGSRPDGASKSSNRGYTLPKPLESMMNFACIVLRFPSASLTVVVESEP